VLLLALCLTGCGVVARPCPEVAIAADLGDPALNAIARQPRAEPCAGR